MRRADGSRRGKPGRASGGRRPSVILRPKGPFDLGLSLEAAASFLPVTGPPVTVFRTPVKVDGGATIIDIWQPSKSPPLICASSTAAFERKRLRAIVKWLVSWDLDLRPFYALAAPHPIMGPAAMSLIGLKPLRPATLFEMAVIAITEQQLSLAAAFHIRARLVRRFGKPLDGHRVFPSPERLATASLRDLAACGLSHRKAEYVKDLARRATQDRLDFAALNHESDQRICEALLSNRGFGEWSVKYILARGFGRPDCLPSGDVGLRRVIGHYFAAGRRLTAPELAQALAPFRPYRGLAAFYLAVHWRLRRGEGKATSRRELAGASDA